MSGKHQRRMWVLPAPTGDISKYDRMQICVGRANSTNIIIDHDTLIKTLVSYLFQQDTFIKTLTSIQVDTDTLLTVSANFNYEVDQDTLIKIISLLNVNQDTSISVTSIIPPSVIESETFISSGHYTLETKRKRKKKIKDVDEVFSLGTIDVSVLPTKSIQIRVEAVLEIKRSVGVTSLSERDVQKLTVLNVEFIDVHDITPIEIVVVDIKEDELDGNN